MIDQYSTQLWKGNIKYGDYEANEWYSVGGWQHPLFQANLRAVQSAPWLFKDLNLYVTGGLLEDWHSWDVDWVIAGAYDPEKIKAAMEWIVSIGFTHRLYPDVHYVDKAFSLYDWQQGDETEWQGWVYSLSDHFSREGSVKDASHYEQVDGMFRHWQHQPFQKNLKMHSEGYKYQQMIKIF